MSETHAIQLTETERKLLAGFATAPSGALRLNNRLTVESTEDGGLLIRTRPHDAWSSIEDLPLERTNYELLVEELQSELQAFLVGHRDRLFDGLPSISPFGRVTVLARVAEALAGSGIVWRDHQGRLVAKEPIDD